jgi:hypothetical protein
LWFITFGLATVYFGVTGARQGVMLLQSFYTIMKKRAGVKAPHCARLAVRDIDLPKLGNFGDTAIG